ncbi:MAG: MFS transporter [Pirellulales bacterium]
MSESPVAEKQIELFEDKSFWGMTVTQFLGAFNDNLFKQLILLLAVAGTDVQGWATTVFSLPFVLLSGLAGFLSDRFSKSRVIFLAKIAEIGIMTLGVVAFLSYDWFGALGTWSVLFLMGTHSTFFGPGKYGILPELFKEKDLARANGIILMSTFLAIIFGTVAAGAMGDWLLVAEEGKPLNAQPLWIGSMVGVGLACVGTAAAWFIRPTPPAQPHAKLTAEDLGVSKDIRHLLWIDRPLLAALLVSCVFWMVSGIAVPTVNRLGKDLLHVDKTKTSLLVAAIAFGIVLGSVIAGLFLKKMRPAKQVKMGLWGIVVALVFLGFWKSNPAEPQSKLSMLGYQGSFVVLFIMGMAAAIYAIPLQVFLQKKPPAAIKGRMIATMNQANFVGILISGPLYQLFEAVAQLLQWPISSVFWMMMLLVLPLALFYRMRDELPSAPQG